MINRQCLRIQLIGYLALLLVTLAACAPSTATPAPAPTSPPAPTSAPAPTSVPSVVSDSAAAVQVVLNYYDAIAQQQYAQAYQMWAQDGAASGQTSAEFAHGYAETAGISVLLDQATVSGDSVTVPVTILSVRNLPDQRQESQRFAGTYSLQFAGGVWRIVSATIAAADAGSAPPAGTADGPDVVKAYYQAINDKNYPRAYTYWDDSGTASHQGYAEFALGFAKTAQVDLVVGQARTEGAAGSLYSQVPVVVFARQSDGARQAFCGTYTLHRANVPPFDSFGWRIASAATLEVADVQPDSELVQTLLNGQCAAR